jgi:putative acetyltransferase
MQPGIGPVHPEDYARLIETWEASVRATHTFVTEADIQFFRPIIWEVLPKIPDLACVRDETGRLTGFVAVSAGKVEMLFIHPQYRGQGAGKRLLNYAVHALGATTLDVNEQNGQAVGFYLHMGFEVFGRSELDDFGKPYPLLHMRLKGGAADAAEITAASDETSL